MSRRLPVRMEISGREVAGVGANPVQAVTVRQGRPQSQNACRRLGRQQQAAVLRREILG